MKVRRNKRQDIIEGAVRLLSNAGSEGFTASALAETAGVSKANLFHHFDTLGDIVIEAFEQYALSLEMMAPPPGMTFREWLSRIGEAQFGLTETGDGLARAYFVFVARALFEERLRTKVLGTMTTASTAFCDIVAELHPDPLTPEEVQSLGDLIFMTADGMAIHLHAFPERRHEIHAAWRRFVDEIASERSIS